MTPRKIARAIAGVVTVIALIGLMAIDTVDPDVTLSLADKLILLSLIASLLGLDMLMEQLPGLPGGDNE